MRSVCSRAEKVGWMADSKVRSGLSVIMQKSDLACNIIQYLTILQKSHANTHDGIANWNRNVKVSKNMSGLLWLACIYLP